MTKEAFARQIKRDEQSPDPSVAIQEWVEGFKLVMADGNANEFWDQNGFVVRKSFEITHEDGEFFVMWWDEDGIGQRGSTDPVLAAAKFTWCFSFASNALHEGGVGLTKETI